MIYNGVDRVLITGASGFLGKELTSYLTQNTLAEILSVPGPSQGVDLLDDGQVGTLIDEFEPSLIFHLVARFDGDLDSLYKTNVLISQRILQHLFESGVRSKVIVMGSAAEYGQISMPDVPVNEQCSLNPITLYGLTKSWQTNLCLYYSRVGVDVRIARLFNLFGDNAPLSQFVGIVQNQISRYLTGDIDHFLLGNLESVRDYTDVEIVSEYLWKIAKQGQSGEIYNVASGKAIKIKDLLFKMLIDSGLDPLNVRIECNRRLSQNVPKIYADISKLENLINGKV